MQKHQSAVATPEEDEEFNRLQNIRSPYADLAKDYEHVAYESQKSQEWALAEQGRLIERFGKLLQDPNTRVNELAWEAERAGFKLCIKIKPKVENATNEGSQA